MKSVWLIEEGRYYQELTVIQSIHHTKKDAVAKCHEDGFVFDRGQGFFCNREQQLYRKMWKQAVMPRRK